MIKIGVKIKYDKYLGIDGVFYFKNKCYFKILPK
jgi:hypothetical protein